MNVLNEYFDKIYVITSYFHKPRIKYINELFNKENIKFDFHYAVHPEFLDGSIIESYLDYLKSNNQIDTLPTSKYRISAAISHLQVLRQFQYSNYNNVLVFEDDVSFESDYQTKLSSFMDNIPVNWDPSPINEPENIEPVTGWLNVILCELNKAKSLLLASSTPLPITTNELKLLCVLYRPAAN